MIGAEMHAWIGLGGNLGEARATIEEAVRALERLPSLKVEAVSGLYRTSPVDASGPDYVNAVVRIGTTLSPMEVLRLLQAVENAFGRIRPAGVHHAPRTLDLDLLHYEDAASSTPELTIPHPRMNERLFVLCPLAEIEPQWICPGGEPIEARIAHIRRIDPTQKICRMED